jgi:hypothetical protein
MPWKNKRILSHCIIPIGEQGLTDGGGGEQQDEGIDDGVERLGDGHDYLAHRRDLAEEPAAFVLLDRSTSAQWGQRVSNMCLKTRQIPLARPSL